MLARHRKGSRVAIALLTSLALSGCGAVGDEGAEELAGGEVVAGSPDESASAEDLGTAQFGVLSCGACGSSLTNSGTVTSFDGVVARSNGAYNGHGSMSCDGNDPVVCDTYDCGVRWHCVEYVSRYFWTVYDQHHGGGRPPSANAGSALCSAYAGDARYTVDSAAPFAPVPGDAFVTGGHTGIIKSVNSNGTWNIIEQNSGADCNGLDTISPSTDGVICVVHHKKNLRTNGGGSGGGGDNSAGADKLKLNTDGYADIFRYDPVNGRVIVSNMTALSGVSNKYDSGNGAWAKGWQNHFADLDGDGDKEVFRYSGGGRVVVTRFNSTLSALVSPNVFDGTAWGDADRKFAFGRIEGKPYENVVSYDPTSGALAYYRFTNTSTTAWSFAATYWADIGTGWDIHTADMNGDGDDEVVRYQPSSGRLIIENGWTRTEVFDSADIGTNFGTGRKMYFGNFNGTGAVELISYNPSSGDFVIYTFNTSVTPWVWDDRHRAGLGAGWVMIPGDLNGGADELYRYQPSTGRVIVEQFSADLMTRTERYDSSGITNWGTNHEHSLADLNGDGLDEVFRYNPASGHVSVTRFTNTTSATWGISSPYFDQAGWGANWDIFVH